MSSVVRASEMIAVGADLVVGIDLGGTKIAGAVVDASGTVGTIQSHPTPAAQGSSAVLDAVAALIRDLTAPLRRDGFRQILGIGIGTAGVVDSHRGRIVSATSAMPGWAGTEVAGGLRTRLDSLFHEELPIHVQNDVDAHATGESWVGAAADVKSALVVAVGTGVGGSIVIDGSVLRGSRHVAGEIGHLPTAGVGELVCSCGRPGHLEALGSGPALHRRYLALGGMTRCADAREVVARASQGDSTALRAVEDSASAVGRAAAAVVTVLDPETVVLTGSLALSGRLWWGAMEPALRRELIDPLGGIPVIPAMLGNAAAVIGAARGAWDLVEGRRQ